MSLLNICKLDKCFWINIKLNKFILPANKAGNIFTITPNIHSGHLKGGAIFGV